MTKKSSPLNCFMINLLGKYQDIPLKVSDDRARTPMTLYGMVCQQSPRPGTLLPNRWGNASPAAGVDSPLDSNHQVIPSLPVDLGPGRWECMSPGRQVSISSPTPPSRKGFAQAPKDDRSWDSPRSMVRPTTQLSQSIKELPY
jgi:hypothetical protein